MQKIGGIELRGTTPERWNMTVRERLLQRPRRTRAVRIWSRSMVTAPEPGESQFRYLIRSFANQKPYRHPITTVGLTRSRIEDRKFERRQVKRRGAGRCTMDPQPIDFGDPEAW